LAAKLSEGTPGSRPFLGAYNRAWHQVEKKLTKDQCQKYLALAKEWSEKKLPLKMQMQYVHSNDSSQLKLTDSSH